MKTEKEIRKIRDQLITIAKFPCTCEGILEQLECAQKTVIRKAIVDSINCVLDEPSSMGDYLEELAYAAAKCKEALTKQKKRLDS